MSYLSVQRMVGVYIGNEFYSKYAPKEMMIDNLLMLQEDLNDCNCFILQFDMSTIIIILSTIICLCSAWTYLANVSQMMAQRLPPNLTNFSTAYNSNLNQLIIYSGISNNCYSNTTYIINLTDNTVKQIVQNLEDVRFEACVLAYQNQLYLFGGYKINATSQVDSGELWKLDLVTLQWSIVEQQLEPYRFCKMIYDNNSILIFGASFDGVLDVFTFQPTTNYFKNLTIEFYGFCGYNVTQWDGSIVNLTIPIEDCPTNINSSLITTSFFPTSTVKYIDLMQTGVSTHHMLQTQDYIYSYQFIPSNWTIAIKYFNRVDKQYGNIKSKSVKYGMWNIFCNWNMNQQNFYVTFVQKKSVNEFRVTKNTPNFYSQNWPDFNNSDNSFCLIMRQVTINSSFVDVSMFLLLHGSLKVYSLHQNVFFQTTTPPGLSKTLFGLNQCLPGWTGSNCTIPACPNSLIINGANGISVIKQECSGHGECTLVGCVCDTLWGGNDCSIYLRSACKGTLLDNFPLQNCQCFNSTVGNNDCSVIFCPGDCFGHGKCVSGVCKCDPNFYGADCSTMVVGFPR